MKRTIQLFHTGIPIVDNAWGGFYHGGTYLLVGEKKSGKTLLSLQFAVESAKNKEVCLYFTNARPKDLIIHAASIDIDLESYINNNSIIIVRVANPADVVEYHDHDEFLSEYLRDIISLINQYNPSRLIFDELTPYVEFENPNLLRESFGQTIETIEDLGITSLLILREPIAATSKAIFNVVNAFATGVIQLHKKDEIDAPQSGIIDITPNIGHAEGKFKANYQIEPYRGITTDFKITKRTTYEDIGTKYPTSEGLKSEKITSPDYLVPNIYSINDFKLIINNQIALFKTTGQKFTIISFKLNPNEKNALLLNFNQLSNSIRLVIDKKDKICTISDKIYVLLTKSDDNVVEEFINKVYRSLSLKDQSGISVLMLKINDRFNNAEEILKEFDLEAARVQLSQR
jgi:KaiC/GvpD/RAD55 family RecA-like ATPase